MINDISFTLSELAAHTQRSKPSVTIAVDKFATSFLAITVFYF